MFSHTRSIGAVALVPLALLFALSPKLWPQKGGANSSGQPAGAGGAQAGSTPFFETQMLAYGAIDEIAEAVTQRTCNSSPTVVPAGATIVIFDPQSFQNLGAWQSFAEGVDALTDAYNTLLPPPAGGVFRAAATGTSGSFLLGGADLGSLITSIAASTTNTASSFTIQDSTMAVSLMRQFQTIHCNVRLVYYPLFGSYADAASAQDQISKALYNLNTVRQKVQTALRCQDKCAGTAVTPSTDPRIAVFNDLNSQYDQLLKDFLALPGQSAGGGPGGGANSASPASATQSTPAASPSSSQSSGSVSLVQGAELENLIEKDNTFILYADVVAAGGTQRDIKNVLTLLTGDWISYSGGAIVNVALIKSKQTRLVFADALRYRTDFHHRDLWDVMGFKSFSTPRKSALVSAPNVGENLVDICNGDPACPAVNEPPIPAPAPVPPAFGAAPDRSSGAFELSQSQIVSGMSLTETVWLSSPAGAGGQDVHVYSSDQTAIPDSTVHVPGNADWGSSAIRALPSSNSADVVLTILGQNILPISKVVHVVPAPFVLNIAPDANGNYSAQASTTSTGVFTLENVPGAPVTLTLASSDTSKAVFSPPTTITIAAPSKSANFSVHALAAGQVVLSAYSGNQVQSIVLNVTP